MVLDMFRLDGKVAVITGAGRGIGAASALALAEAGADVVLSARSEDQLQEVAKQVADLGRRAHIIPADAMDLDQVAALAGGAVDAFGRLDIVVNNVGGSMPKEFLKTNTKFLEEAFHFNVSTAHALTRAALPHLLKEVSICDAFSTSQILLCVYPLYHCTFCNEQLSMCPQYNK